MANRFLETNYYKSPFVRGLKGSLKGLYSFIICDCTPAGIWSMDMEAASLYIGFTVTEQEFYECFVKKGKAIPLNNGKFFFPDFIEHQYPKGLSDKNIAHNNIIPELKKRGLIDENNKIVKPVIIDPLKPLERPKGNDIGSGIGKHVFNTKPTVNDFNGLPEPYIQKSIELIYYTVKYSVDIDTIKSMWEIFKVQKLTGEEYYPNEGKVYSYFMNWLKNQNFGKNGTDKQTNNTTKFNAGALELLAKGKEQFAAITGKQNSGT